MRLLHVIVAGVARTQLEACATEDVRTQKGIPETDEKHSELSVRPDVSRLGRSFQPYTFAMISSLKRDTSWPSSARNGNPASVLSTPKSAS